MDGKNIVMEGFDLTKFANAMSAESRPGETVQGLFGSATKGGTTSFDTLDGAFNINQGIIDITKLDLDGKLNSLTTVGTVNLPAWTLKTAHTITVKPTVEGAEPIPPFTVNISGSLSNPTNTLGQGILSDYLNRKIQRKVGNLIEDKFGKELEDKGLGGLLQGLTGQKPAPKAPTPVPVVSTPNTPAPVAPAPVAPAAVQQQAVTPEAAPVVEPAPQQIEPAAQAEPEAAPVAPAPAAEAATPAEKTDEEKAMDAVDTLLQNLSGQ